MFAHVYPILRLPRASGAFTYAVPEHFSVSRGSIVRIPWRSKAILGVVASFSSTAPQNAIRSLTEVVDTMSPHDLGVYEEVAKETFQSVSSVLHTLGAWGKQKEITRDLVEPLSASIRAKDLAHLKHSAANSDNIRFIQTTDLAEVAALVKLLINRFTSPQMVLVPHEHDLEVLSRLLPKAVCASSALSSGERAALAHAWKNGDIRLLIGTRIIAGWIPPRDLASIVVVRSHVLEHANYDRNPRYDARRLARAWAKQRKAPLFITGPVVRAADMHPAIPAHWHSPLLQTLANAPVVSLTEELPRSTHPLLSDPLLEAIEERLQNAKRVLLFFNTKGVARRLACRRCSFVERCVGCQKPLAVYETYLACSSCKRFTKRPERCRSCGAQTLKEAGAGTHAIEKELKKRFPSARISRVEKGHPGDPCADIVLATTFYLEGMRTPTVSFGLVAILCAEAHLRGSEFAGTERALATYLEAAGVAYRSGGDLFFQAWDLAVTKKLCEDPVEALASDRRIRKQLGQPPYQQTVEIQPFRSKDVRRVRETDAAWSTLPELPDTTIIKPLTWL